MIIDSILRKHKCAIGKINDETFIGTTSVNCDNTQFKFDITKYKNCSVPSFYIVPAIYDFNKAATLSDSRNIETDIRKFLSKEFDNTRNDYKDYYTVYDKARSELGLLFLGKYFEEERRSYYDHDFLKFNEERGIINASSYEDNDNLLRLKRPSEENIISSEPLFDKNFQFIRQEDKSFNIKLPNLTKSSIKIVQDPDHPNEFKEVEFGADNNITISKYGSNRKHATAFKLITPNFKNYFSEWLSYTEPVDIKCIETCMLMNDAIENDVNIVSGESICLNKCQLKKDKVRFRLEAPYILLRRNFNYDNLEFSLENIKTKHLVFINWSRSLIVDTLSDAQRIDLVDGGGCKIKNLIVSPDSDVLEFSWSCLSKLFSFDYSYDNDRDEIKTDKHENRGDVNIFIDNLDFQDRDVIFKCRVHMKVYYKGQLLQNGKSLKEQLLRRTVSVKGQENLTTTTKLEGKTLFIKGATKLYRNRQELMNIIAANSGICVDKMEIASIVVSNDKTDIPDYYYKNNYSKENRQIFTEQEFTDYLKGL